jgi:hypothetical protein
MGPTELKMQPALHFRKKLAIEIKISSFFRKMYCGLHFQFRRVRSDQVIFAFNLVVKAVC